MLNLFVWVCVCLCVCVWVCVCVGVCVCVTLMRLLYSRSTDMEQTWGLGGLILHSNPTLTSTTQENTCHSKIRPLLLFVLCRMNILPTDLFVDVKMCGVFSRVSQIQTDTILLIFTSTEGNKNTFSMCAI